MLYNALTGMWRSTIMNKKSGRSQVLQKKTLYINFDNPYKIQVHNINKLEIIFLIITSNDNFNGCIWLNPIAIPILVVVST